MLHAARYSAILLVASIVACDDGDAALDFDPPEPPAAQPDAGMVIRPDLKPGDALGNGTVEGVYPSDNCTGVRVEYPAAWRCSEAQIEEARASQQGTTSIGRGGSSVPLAPPEPVGTTKTAALLASSCADLAELRRAPLKARLRSEIHSARRQQLVLCLPTFRTHYFDAQGQETTACPQSARDWPQAAGVGSAASGGSLPGGGGSVGGAAVNPVGASAYSTTNNQVAGVDEADFVKNDAQYVYVLSATALHVIDAWPAEQTHEVHKLILPGLPTRLFLHGTKLVVYLRLHGQPGVPPGAPSGAQACTYGYGCRFGAEPGSTLMQVYDVASPASPRLLQQYEMSGGYVASRRVGGVVYTVVYDQPVASAPGVDTTVRGIGPAWFEQDYAEKLAAAERAVDELPNEYFLPWVEQRNESASVVNRVTSCDDALAAKSASGASFTSLVAVDLDALGAPQRTLVASKAGFVYASGAALYMATEGSDGADGYYGYYGPSADERSAIHKFALDGTDVRYVGSALIRGHVLNQFAMDERDGVLRVATTSGRVPAPDASSNVTTLAERAGELSLLGELTGLAPTEDIRSVRFDGERGFVVTFKKTDPLFVIDLARPEAPKVLGELKIPGFSTYMHPLDRDHLLAIGFDADDQGSFAFFDGIQLQIFDVSVLSDPKLRHKTTIGTRGSASDALTNHLAFNYFAPKGLLALPMTVCEGGDAGRVGSTLTFSGLMLFDVSLGTGIKERGRMPFASTAVDTGIGGCFSWWTSGKSTVKRSIIMDDYAIGISDAVYQVAPISDAGRALATLALQ
jgi:hypothetical protein